MSRAFTYNEIADQDLQDLGLQTGAASKELLKDANQKVPQRCADESAVCCHLGHTRANVVAMLALVMGKPRSQDLLQGRKRARREHLSSKRVRLKLLEVGLFDVLVELAYLSGMNVFTYSQIASLRVSSRQPLADSVRSILVSRPWHGRVTDCLFLKFNRHSGFLWG